MALGGGHAWPQCPAKRLSGRAWWRQPVDPLGVTPLFNNAVSFNTVATFLPPCRWSRCSCRSTCPCWSPRCPGSATTWAATSHCATQAGLGVGPGGTRAVPARWGSRWLCGPPMPAARLRPANDTRLRSAKSSNCEAAPQHVLPLCHTCAACMLMARLLIVRACPARSQPGCPRSHAHPRQPAAAGDAGCGRPGGGRGARPGAVQGVHVTGGAHSTCHASPALPPSSLPPGGVHAAEAAMHPGRPVQVYDALNALGSTAWSVNPDVFRVVETGGWPAADAPRAAAALLLPPQQSAWQGQPPAWQLLCQADWLCWPLGAPRSP